MSRGARRAALVLAIALSASCTLFNSLDGFSTPGSEADAGVDAPAVEDSLAPIDAADGGARSDADASADGGCPSGRGPVMVAATPTLCIDSTEVTRGQYDTFLSSGPSLADQPPECAGNTSFIPAFLFPTPASFPVVGIDWCDARAFCAWAGKRLCGAIDGGAVDFDQASSAATSQWMFACTRGGTRKFPYGNAFDPAACNGHDLHPDGALAAVGSTAGCVGGYPGLSDMAGNVWEFLDSCASDAGPTNCRVGGHSVESEEIGQAVPSCAISSFGRLDIRQEVGFRCCGP